MKKILAIDDQNDNLIAIKGFLKNFMPNCKLFLALSGKEGIAIAQKEQPDTILLDIIMPEMDGFEVCKILKQNELTKYIPIIMLSALGQDTDSRVKGLNLGADAFLAKPFVPIELQAQINVMLRIKEAEDEIKSEKRDLEKKIENRTKELVENEEKYRNVVERATDGICIVQDSIVKFVNPRLIEIWGGNAENVIGRPFTNFVYPENIKKLTLYYQKRLAGKDVPSIYETTLLHDSGRKVYVEVSSGIITYLGKSANLVIIRDISDRKKDEQEITKLSTAVEQSPAAIAITDLKGNIEYTNPRFSELTGYSEEELIGKNTSILKSNNHSKDFYKKLWTTISSGKIWRGVFENMKKNGDLFWETASISPILNNKGIITNYIKIAEDITKKKRNDQIQNVIYNISNAANTNHNLKQLIGIIQQELGRIIDTTNFYVALYNNEEDTISLPFFVDEYEDFTSLPADKTISKYVIKTQKSLLASLQKLKELEKAGEIRRYGQDSLIWLGVPLRVEGKVTGVLVIQSYTDENAFDESDVKILVFVSDQISISIERKKKEEKLLFALEKATESDRLKSAFLATISHELRTPLNAVIGFSDLINKSLPIEDVYDYATIINSSGIHLLNIVEDLFDITLIESGETKISKKEIEINSFLNDINKITIAEQNKLNKNNIILNLIVPKTDEKLVLYTDSSKLKQIFSNLLKNALKFTHTGQINYGFSIEDIQGKSYCKFYVQDTGIGISKDKHEIIFNIFRQIDDSHTRTYEGTGIGLSISKKLTELLGGNLWLESEEGIGSTFHFTIPLQVNIKPVVKKEKNTVEEVSVNSEKDTNDGRKTILIVEDDLDSLEFLKILLEMANIDTCGAHNGEEAIKYCNENSQIDLVLMDINMPVMNGFEATKEIKKIRPLLPIIAQTAYAIAGDKEKAIDAGCDDYISKPIKREKLMEMITRLI